MAELALADHTARPALLGACDELISALEILARRGRVVRFARKQADDDSRGDDQPELQTEGAG